MLPSGLTRHSLKVCSPGGRATSPSHRQPSVQASGTAAEASGDHAPSSGQLPTRRRFSPNCRWQSGTAKDTGTGGMLMVVVVVLLLPLPLLAGALPS